MNCILFRSNGRVNSFLSCILHPIWWWRKVGGCLCACACVCIRGLSGIVCSLSPLPLHTFHSPIQSTIQQYCTHASVKTESCSYVVLTWKWVQWPFIYLADAERLWQNDSPSPQWWQISEAARQSGLRGLDMMRGIGCTLKCRGEESNRNRTKRCIRLARNAVSFFQYKGKLLPANTSTCQPDRTYEYLQVWVGTRMHTCGCESGLCSVLLCERYCFFPQKWQLNGCGLRHCEDRPWLRLLPCLQPLHGRKCSRQLWCHTP